MGFRGFWGLGSRVWGFGFWGLGSRVWGLGFGASGFGFGVLGLGFRGLERFPEFGASGEGHKVH